LYILTVSRDSVVDGPNLYLIHLGLIPGGTPYDPLEQLKTASGEHLSCATQTVPLYFTLQFTYVHA